MGGRVGQFLREAKQAEVAAKHAATARGEGRTVFLYTHIPQDRPTFSAPVGGAAEVIEAIEQQSWGLQQMAWDPKPGDRGAVLLLFRAYR
jgi:hypothetical protein